MIQALAQRHSADPAAKRADLDLAVRQRHADVARQFPDDLEAATFFADAMMNLRPWNLWAPDGTAYPGTDEIVVTLERVSPAIPTIRARCTCTSTPSRRARSPAGRSGRGPPECRRCPGPGTSCTCRRTSTGGWGATAMR